MFVYVNSAPLFHGTSQMVSLSLSLSLSSLSLSLCASADSVPAWNKDSGSLNKPLRFKCLFHVFGVRRVVPNY